MATHVTNANQFAPYTNLITATTHWSPTETESLPTVDFPRDRRGKIRHDMYFERTKPGYQQAIRNTAGLR